MEQLALALMMAVTAEGLVEYGKSAAAALAGGGWRAAALQGGAAAVSVALCLGSGADLYAPLGVQFAAGWVGPVLTGIFASRGSNYLSDLIGRLRGGRRGGSGRGGGRPGGGKPPPARRRRALREAAPCDTGPRGESRVRSPGSRAVPGDAPAGREPEKNSPRRGEGRKRQKTAGAPQSAPGQSDKGGTNG